MNTRKRTSIFNGWVWVATATTFCGPASPARAGSIVLGDSGWEAIWDDSLDSFVDIAVDLVTPDAVFIEKSAEFTEPPGPGGFPAIAIVFRQIAASAVNRIVINDEIITNSTGADWGGFRFETINHGEALFNPTLTDASGGGNGFRTSPFGNQHYSADGTIFTVDGFGLAAGGGDAILPNGSIWFPGIGSGELYIDVTPKNQAPFALFTLKETPVPEPVCGLLLATGALLAGRRRSRRPTLR